MMMLKSILLSFVLLIASEAWGANTFFASAAQGSNNGADCADAYAYNDGTYGLGVAGTWAADAILHLCGTITASPGASNFITAQASGSSGHPVTLKFETGAILTATYWSGAAIQIGSHSYITVDGGTNGVVQATANGSSLANQQDNGECVAGAHSANEVSIIVENLTCKNLYVHALTSDEGGQDTYGIDIWDVSGLTISNNTITNVKWGIRYSYGSSTYSNVSISGNTISNVDHGIFATPGGGAGTFSSGFNVYGNAVTHLEVWDDTNATNHHDCFHINSATGSNFNGVSVYNNSCITDPGATGNSGVFISPDNSSMGAVNVFNNIVDASLSLTNFFADCSISLGNVSNSIVANNTVVGPNANGSGYTKPCGILFGGASGGTGESYLNNIVIVYAMPSWFTQSNMGSAATVDYNDFYGVPAGGGWQSPTSSFYTSLASWMTATGYDAHSITTNPNLTGSYRLNTGSLAIGAGTNLYATCNGQSNPGLGALCYDAAGVARPATGNWVMGAFSNTVIGATISGATTSGATIP